MDRKEFLELIEEMGKSLMHSSYNDPYQSAEDTARDSALCLVGDLIRDWAEEKLQENPCPYTQSHTREWCGYELCRES